MTIDFKSIRAELDQLEEVQKQAQQAFAHKDSVVQESGKLKQAACFLRLADSYKSSEPYLRRNGTLIMDGVINSVTKKE